MDAFTRTIQGRVGMQNRFILKFTDKSYCNHWTMYIDLQELDHDAGRKEFDPVVGFYYVVYPIKSVRKLFRYLLKNASNTELINATRIISENYSGKLWKYWKAEAEKCRFIIPTDSSTSEKQSEDQQPLISS